MSEDIKPELEFLYGYAEGLRYSDIDKCIPLRTYTDSLEQSIAKHSIETKKHFEVLQAFCFGIGDSRLIFRIASILEKLRL
jgi:hypothetical protein